MEEGVAGQAAEKNSAGAEEEARRGALSGLEADLVADPPAQGLSALVRHALRHADGANSPRLKVPGYSERIQRGGSVRGAGKSSRFAREGIGWRRGLG